MLSACTTYQKAPVIPAKKPPAHSGDTYNPPKSSASTRSPTISTKRSQLLPSAQKLVAEARSALANGNYQAASIKAERASRISPRAPEVYEALSEVRIKQKKYTFCAILLREHKGLPMTIMKVM